MPNVWRRIRVEPRSAVEGESQRWRSCQVEGDSKSPVNRANEPDSSKSAAKDVSDVPASSPQKSEANEDSQIGSKGSNDKKSEVASVDVKLPSKASADAGQKSTPTGSSDSQQSDRVTTANKPSPNKRQSTGTANQVADGKNDNEASLAAICS